MCEWSWETQSCMHVGNLVMYQRDLVPVTGHLIHTRLLMAADGWILKCNWHNKGVGGKEGE